MLEDITESISLDENSPDPDEADSLEHLNETDDDWRDVEIMERRANPWSADDEERREHLYNSIVAPARAAMASMASFANASTPLAPPEIRPAGTAGF